jgi:hypothetical protein
MASPDPICVFGACKLKIANTAGIPIGGSASAYLEFPAPGRFPATAGLAAERPYIYATQAPETNAHTCRDDARVSLDAWSMKSCVICAD